MLKTNNNQTHWSYCKPSLVSVAPLFSTSHGTGSSQLLSCLLSRVAFGEYCADTVAHTVPRTPSKPSAGAKGVPAVVSQPLGIRQPPELGTRAAARTGHPRPSPGRSPPPRARRDSSCDASTSRQPAGSRPWTAATPGDAEAAAAGPRRSLEHRRMRQPLGLSRSRRIPGPSPPSVSAGDRQGALDLGPSPSLRVSQHSGSQTPPPARCAPAGEEDASLLPAPHHGQYF